VVDCFWYLNVVWVLKAVSASVGVNFTYSLEKKLRGMCPVRSCMIVLDCFLVSWNIFFWKLLNENSKSSLENRTFLGDPSQTLLQSLLSLVEYSCLITEALTGRGEHSR
jgi:uncharacterized membrane protein YbhN (UPF0104 family)